MEYHKTKDILPVRDILGHKSINNTLLYTAGFEYICDFNGNKLFRKRK